MYSRPINWIDKEHLNKTSNLKESLKGWELKKYILFQVTAMCSSNGFLIAGVGQKIYAYSFKSGDLVGIAFVDAQVYTISLAAARNIIIAADMSRSLSLIRFQIHHKVSWKQCEAV